MFLQDKFVVIITSLGKLYYQPIIYDLSVQDGPIYFTMDLTIKHTSVTVSEGCVLCEGVCPVMMCICRPSLISMTDWLTI